MNKGHAQLERGWSLVLTLSLVHFCAFADRSVSSAFAPAIRESFHLRDAQLGALQGTALIVPYTIAAIACGGMLARFNPLRVIGVSILMWTLACAAFAMAGSYPALLLARGAIGVGQALFAPAAIAILAQGTRPQATIAFSVFTAGSATGRSGGMIAAGLLLAILTAAMPAARASDAWRFASLWLLVPNLVLAALLLRFAGPAPAPNTRTAPGLRDALRCLLREPRAFGGHILAACASIAIVQSAGGWAPSILHRNFHLDVSGSAAAFGAVILVCAPLGHLSAGRVLAGQREARAPGVMMVCGVALALLSCAVLLFAAELWLALGALGGLTLGGGFAVSAGMIGFQQMIDPRVRVPGSALFMAAGSLAGYGTGPLATGALSDAIGAPGGGLRAALLIATTGAGFLVAIGAWISVPGWRRMHVLGTPNAATS